MISLSYSTTSPKASCELQKVLGIYNKFDFSEIYPRRKFSHFEKYQFESYLSSILNVVLLTVLSLKRKSQVDYRDMIFFDDERWNISDITTLGNYPYRCKFSRDEIFAKSLKTGFSCFIFTN